MRSNDVFKDVDVLLVLFFRVAHIAAGIEVLPLVRVQDRDHSLPACGSIFQLLLWNMFLFSAVSKIITKLISVRHPSVA